MLIQVLHNIDSRFGEWEADHRLTLVATLDLPRPLWPRDAEPDSNWRALGWAYELLNIGDDPECGTPDPQAVAYRQNGNRSLSVGDVLLLGDTAWSVDRSGWSPIGTILRMSSVGEYGSTPLGAPKLPGQAWDTSERTVGGAA